jgi:hypothetical protein
MLRTVAAILACALSGACASIIEGRSQQVFVNTNPTGADCGLYRDGLRLGIVQNAPGSLLIEKTKRDIWVACVKPGYQMATYLNHSGVAGATWGNLVAGGLVGWAVDSASGADNHYTSPVNMTLVPNVAGQQSGPSSLPSTFAGGSIEPSGPAPQGVTPAAPAPVGTTMSAPPPPPPPYTGPDVVPAAAGGPEVDCVRSDGMRMRVSGVTCPPQSMPSK